MTRQPAVALPPGGDSTDRQLLERFATEREEAAFAALVRRHGAVVLGVCRRELGCEHDAEEVFQATFLALARRAALVPWQDSVRHWLLAVARRLSLRARCSARRPGRGGHGDAECLEVCDPRSDPPTTAAFRETRLILDEELGQLPEKYRAPLVLCYLEGKTNEQAACELGWRPGSMSRRLSRARAQLRERLSRRGLALFVTLGCLALVCLWLLVGGAGPRSRPGVAAAMAPFAPGGECEDFEVALLRAAEHPPVPAEDHDRLARMAQEAVRVSDLLAGHDPGPRRQDWRRMSEQMRLSALGLTEALAHNDDGATRKAARKLLVSCQSCHASFRD